MLITNEQVLVKTTDSYMIFIYHLLRIRRRKSDNLVLVHIYQLLQQC
jgi:hypothetical protein